MDRKKGREERGGRAPNEQCEPMVNGTGRRLSPIVLHGCNVAPSSMNVYFWICTGAKSARIVTL